MRLQQPLTDSQMEEPLECGWEKAAEGPSFNPCHILCIYDHATSSRTLRGSQIYHQGLIGCPKGE